MDKEDGEMSDGMLVDDDEEMILQAPLVQEKPSSTVLYKAQKDGLMIRELGKVDASKIEERAKRFGLDLTGNRVITQGQIDELYANFGIESGNERHFRFDAIYLNGISGLTTRDIFQYLEDYKPVSLEWIDEMSCNVVCQDHISAALALLLHSREIKDKELKAMLAEKSTHHWREGVPHPKNDLILMRFATNGEQRKIKKKPEPKPNDQYYDQIMESVSKNPWGDLCKSWGVYDHQEVFQRKLKNDYEDEIEEEEEEPRRPIQIRNKRLAMRLGKRNHSVDNQSDESLSDSEWKSKSKTPRMRMHADDEESKIKKRKAPKVQAEEKYKPKDKYAPLSIEVVNGESEHNIKRESTRISDKFKFHGCGRGKPSGVQSRLGEKIVLERAHDFSHSEESNDDSSDESSEHNIMSRVQKVSSRSKESSSVWSRLDVNSGSNASNSQNDLRQMLKSKSKSTVHKPNDLRERLGKSKHANLRIEIDNQK